MKRLFPSFKRLTHAEQLHTKHWYFRVFISSHIESNAKNYPNNLIFIFVIFQKESFFVFDKASLVHVSVMCKAIQLYVGVFNEAK